MIIIPAIDIMNGRCVRLTQGDFSNQKIYSENPLEVAKSFESAGLTHLHLVDLDGAKEGKVKHWDVIQSITSNTNLTVDFGGGIKTEDEVEKLFNFGVNQINIGSLAVKDPAKVKSWINAFGSEKIILSADVREEMIAASGWMEDTSLSVFDFINDFIEAGLQYVTITDISKDGLLSGPNHYLYKRILNSLSNIQPLATSLKLIASGGVSSMNDLKKLRAAGCYGCIVGKAIYEEKVTLNELINFNQHDN